MKTWREWSGEPTRWETTAGEHTSWRNWSARQRWTFATLVIAIAWLLGWATLSLLGATSTATVILLLAGALPFSIGIIAVASRPQRTADHLRQARVATTLVVVICIAGAVAATLLLSFVD